MKAKGASQSMNMLAMDSSNKTMTVAIMEDDCCLAEITVTNTLQHSTQLMPAIEQVFQQSKLKVNQIDRIAVAQGPGSYTGLRIGVTLAKTLSYAMNCELVGISSLAVLAANVDEQAAQGSQLVPFFDARRDNIFTGVYAWREGQLVETQTERHISWEKWLELLQASKENYHFIGQMDSAQEARVLSILGDRAHFADEGETIPKASQLGRLALSACPVDQATFTPTYLKLAEAEENWMQTHPDMQEVDYVERL